MPLKKVKRNMLLIALALGLTHVLYLLAGLLVSKQDLKTTLLPTWMDVTLYIIIVLFAPITIAVLKIKTAKAVEALKNGATSHEGIANAVISSGITSQVPTLICLIYMVSGHTPDPLYISVIMGASVVLLGIVPEIEHYVKDADALLPRE